ncbi:MAG: HD domain-containing protein [Planctomycetota bacterium]
MARPRLFRDPVHGQIRYDQVDLQQPLPPATQPGRRFSWLMLRLIDSPEFQRLRHIRQLGIANLVFHGAEHSRFAHSMGAAWLAQEMFDRIVRNTDDKPPAEYRAACCAAALLHDIGHGPFSHTLEDTLELAGTAFRHEHMTVRLLLDEDSGVNRILSAVDAKFPTLVASFIDRRLRTFDHWMYRVVSSQLDCDRLDYIVRDALFTGMHGTGFDLQRLLDMLMHDRGTRIAVHLKGIGTVESYLIAMDLMYRSVYFHHTSRAAAYNLRAVLHRAWSVFGGRGNGGGDKGVFMEYDLEQQPGQLFAEPRPHPLRELFETGEAIDLASYLRLNEHHVWSLIDHWRDHPDPPLADLASRVEDRRLFKTLDLDPHREPEAQELLAVARDMARKQLPQLVTDDTAALYVAIDTSHRQSYRRSVWGSGEPDEAIWIKAGDTARPIDEMIGRKLVHALREELLYPRLVFPGEIRTALMDLVRTTPRLRAALLHPELV